MAINLDHVTEQITVTDTATNASLTVQPKGTGAFNIATGSSGVNLSNGGTVTAITRTVLGGYTSVPSVALSAPTTAGGVQATATCYVQITSATIAGGGTGYTVGDTITMVGGTLAFGGAGTFRVATVSGGVITSVDTPNFAAYAVVPTNPVSITGGTGSGATLNVNYFIGAFTITNAGSGYVEQPTVTFSGGGGSGAAAYATVGSTSTVRTLGSVVNFATPGGTAFSVADTSRATVDFWQAVGATGTVGLVVAGATGNNNGYISAKGTGYVGFSTNSFSSEQARVSHTASAVNYVQATGAATGSGPTISAQGSDTNIDLTLTPKGTGAVLMGTTASNAGISGAAPIAVMYQPNSARHGIVASCATAGYDVGLIWNRSTSGNNRFFEFATESSYTSRGSIDYDRTIGVVRYNTTSDERLKKNIADSASAIAEIMDLKVRQFDWKETNNHVDFGFIAQELLVTCPSAVSVGDDKEDGSIKRPWGIDTSQLVPILVKAIQELQERVKILESK